MKHFVTTLLMSCLALLAIGQGFTGSTKHETVLFADQQSAIQYNKGIAFYATSQPDSAIACFTKALEYDAQQTDALYNRAVLYFETKNYAKALEDLQLLNNGKQNPAVSVLLGKTHLKLGDKALAMQSFNSAIKTDPSNASIYYYRGNLQYQNKAYEKALEDFSTAVKLNPQLAIAYNDRGIVYRTLEQYEKALEDFKKATLLDAQLDFAFDNLGDIRMKMNRFKEAETDFTAALKINPDNYIAFNNRGLARLKLGEYVYALEDFNTALSINPNFTEAKGNKGYTLFLQEDYDASLQLFTEILQKDPNNGKILFNRGIVKEMLRDELGACDDWQKALDLGIQESQQYLKNCK